MTTTPTADVLTVHGKTVTIRCPYCHSAHVHELRTGASTSERRAPGCGLIRTGPQRLTGYRFTTEANR